ncbi:hypothetical protein ABT383_35525 [Streptomyces humidus]|uniref:hypothetical protein n=1 Tax=Streptomyces humidus TaxID=52259 RepID=UPI001E3C07D7|nr:hypothetical protein [Streptomyces humidus]
MVLLSQDEQDAVHVRRLLPDRLAGALVRHTSVEEGCRTSGTHGALCVLVGSAPAGRTLADVVIRVRRHAPDAAVLVLEARMRPTPSALSLARCRAERITAAALATSSAGRSGSLCNVPPGGHRGG